jgi:hypothetical protein
LGLEILDPFRQLIEMMASRNCNMSAYFPGCVAVRNGIKKTLNSRQELFEDSVFADCIDVIDVCFNFNGTQPADDDLCGLLQPEHLWIFSCDPYSRQLDFDLDLLVGGTGLSGLISDMVLWGTSSDTNRANEVKVDFNFFHTGSGTFSGKFGPIANLWNQTVVNDSITLNDVIEWVRKTGGHEARLAWFAVNAKHSLFYKTVAHQLLSVCYTGSMILNRIAPQLSNSAHAIDSRTSPSERRDIEMQVRSGLNLRFHKDATNVPSYGVSV